jgi:ribonuclease BN (tRNA processing enzyme)
MEETSIQFLGTGDAFGSGGRFQSCIYTRFKAMHSLIDCGATSLVAMKRFGVDPLLIDNILLSHLHGDHFGGVPYFIMEAHYELRRRKPLVVVGPPGLEARIFETMEVLYPGSSQSDTTFPLEFIELTDKITAKVGSVMVTPYTVVHPSGAPSYALRIALGDKILAYSGDTEWTDALIPVARGADLFVCECAFLQKSRRYHLDYQTLVNHRAELECRKLILTHMNDDMLHRLGSLDVEGAEDGKIIAL